MAHMSKPPEAMPVQSTRNTDVVSVSSDECEITRVIPHNACNADTQANDYIFTVTCKCTNVVVIYVHITI